MTRVEVLVPKEGNCTFTELYSVEMLLSRKLMSCLYLQKQGWGLYGKYQYAFAYTCPHRRKSLPRPQERHTPACPPCPQVSTRLS